MKKILAWCLLLCMLIVPVQAAEFETVTFEEESLSFSMEDTISLLEAGTFTGTRYEEQLSGDTLAIYQTLKNSALGTGKDTVFTERVDLGLEKTWEDVTFVYDEATGRMTPDAETVAKVNEYLNEVMLMVAHARAALILDEPELSWMVNIGFKVSWGGAGSYLPDEEDPKVGYGWYRALNLKFRLSEDDLESAAKTGTLAVFKEALAAAKAELEADDGEYDIDRPGMNRYERAAAIHEYVCDTVSYAEGDLSPREYQTVYSALIDPAHATVCAGYAKMTKVLCDAYDIPCMLVTGESFGEPHMWNYVQMIDGNWYAVDATWDDDITKVSEDYFLGGQDVFDQEHTPFVNWGYGYPFAYPTLAEHAYVPVPELVLSTINGAQIRVTGNQGLRFISTIEKSGDFADAVEYGMVLIPSADISDVSELVIGATLNGHAVAQVAAKNLYAVTDESVTFTAVITNIKEKNYARDYTARAYAVLSDGSVVYSDVGASRSIYGVAKRGLENPNETDANKAVFQAIVDVVEG